MSAVSSSPCIGLQLGQGGRLPGALGPELSVDLVRMGCRLTLPSPRVPDVSRAMPHPPRRPSPTLQLPRALSCPRLSATAALGSRSPAGAFSQL